MVSFDRPRGNDAVRRYLRTAWEAAGEPPLEAAPAYPEELESLCREVRALAPAVLANLVSPFPDKGKPHLRLNYRHRGGQIIYDEDTGFYRRRVTWEAVGRPGQVKAAALGLVRELGALRQP